MAIYHCTTKTVNRSSGRTAVASMAYRAGEKLKDERTGLTPTTLREKKVWFIPKLFLIWISN